MVRCECRVDTTHANPRIRVEALHQQHRIPRALPPVRHDGGDPDLIRYPALLFFEELSLRRFAQKSLDRMERLAKLVFVAMMLREFDRGSREALLHHGPVVGEAPLQRRTDLDDLPNLLLDFALLVWIEAVEQSDVVAKVPQPRGDLQKATRQAPLSIVLSVINGRLEQQRLHRTSLWRFHDSATNVSRTSLATVPSSRKSNVVPLTRLLSTFCHRIR